MRGVPVYLPMWMSPIDNCELYFVLGCSVMTIDSIVVEWN